MLKKGNDGLSCPEEGDRHSFKHSSAGILLARFLNCPDIFSGLTVGESQFKGPSQVTQDALGPSHKCLHAPAPQGQ